MKTLLCIAAAAVLLCGAAAAQPADYSYEIIDDPDDNIYGITVGDINNTDTLAGSYQNGVSGFRNYGYIYKDGVYTTIDHPESQQGGTSVTAINDDDQVVGNYFTVTGGYQSFLYDDGAFTPIVHPDAVRGTTSRGLNNAGTIVGEYLDVDFVAHSFSYADGEFSSVAHPRALPGTTHINGISDSGVMAGTYEDGTGLRGFINVKGIYIDIDHPEADANGTVVTGVNSSTEAVGYYVRDTVIHGFLYSKGVFTPIDHPEATGGTVPGGINDDGVIAGYIFINEYVVAFTATPEREPLRTDNVIAGLGINTHIDSSNPNYDDLDAIVESLAYLGLRNVRDSPTVNSREYWGYIADAAGVAFNAYIPSTSKQGMKNALDLMTPLARDGLLNAIEGGNESDNPYPVSLGNSLTYTAQFQLWVYQTGRALRLPVVNMSFGQGWTADDNWQGNYDEVGDLGAYADYANAHTFPEPDVGQPDMTIQMLSRNARLAASLRPVVHTELGWDSRTPDEDVPGAMLQGVLDAVLNGSPRIYLYALFDDPGRTFGLMNPDATPKPEGRAFRNLMMLLADDGDDAATFAREPLPYRVATTTGGERSLLMQKSDGSYWLALWNETEAAHSVTVNLESPVARIQVFDPLAGTTPIHTVNDADAVTVTMAGPPLLIAFLPEIEEEEPPAPNTVVSFADNTVISGNDGTTAIYAYGTGNTINGGGGTYTLLAMNGGNIINSGAGTATLYVGGADNRLVFGPGPVTLHDSGNGTTHVFGPLGSGVVEIYGYIFGQNDVLDFRTVLADTPWTGDVSAVGNFLKVTTQGANIVISVNPTGLSGGTLHTVAIVHGYANMTLNALLARSVIAGGGALAAGQGLGGA